jgi:hypothetical protein
MGKRARLGGKPECSKIIEDRRFDDFGVIKGPDVYDRVQAGST